MAGLCRRALLEVPCSDAFVCLRLEYNSGTFRIPPTVKVFSLALIIAAKSLSAVP